MIALLSLGFASCVQNEFVPEPAQKTVAFAKKSVKLAKTGESAIIGIKANTDWTVSTPTSWIKLSPAEGTPATLDVTVTVDVENPNADPRSGIVVLASKVNPLATDTLSVTQKGQGSAEGALRNAEDFMAFIDAAESATTSDVFTIEEDIDMEGEQIPSITSFKGVLDGKGHKLYNFTIVSEEATAGLMMSCEGTIKNLIVGSADGSTWDKTTSIKYGENITGTAVGLVAQLAGALDSVINYASIEFNGIVASDNCCAGGLAGCATGSEVVIRKCENHGNVTFTAAISNKSFMGGILGYNSQAGTKVMECKNCAAISFSISNSKEFSYAGIVGRSDVKVEISDCVNEGLISNDFSGTGGTYIHLAGIIGSGYKGCVITNCTNKGGVSSSRLQVNRMGGIAGTINTGGTLENCVNEGNIIVNQAENTNWQGIGGICGFEEKSTDKQPMTIRNCTNKGDVSCIFNNTTTHANNIGVGGIIGICCAYPVIQGNTNNAKVSVANEGGTMACTGGIIGRHQTTATLTTGENVNNGAVLVNATTGIAGGVVGFLAAGATVENDKNLAEITCNVAANTGSVGGLNGGKLKNCTAGGKVNGTEVTIDNVQALVMGSASTGTAEGTKTPSGEVVPSLALETTSVSVKAEETSASFNVLSNIAWTVATEAAWITDYTKSGENDGSVSISFPAYTETSADRTAIFTVSAEGVAPVTFTLTQEKVLDDAPHCVPNIDELKLLANESKKAGADFSRWTDEHNVINITADIDASSLTCPVDTIPAGITVNGNDHTITLAFDSGEYSTLALFANMYGNVKNLKIAGSVKTTSTVAKHNVSGLVGILYKGTIDNCTNSATITDASTVTGDYAYIAGIASQIREDGATVKNCTHNGDIIVTESEQCMIGGITAYGVNVLNSTITFENCTCSGNITVTQPAGNVNWNYIGGMIGKIGASKTDSQLKTFTIKNCNVSSTITINSAFKIRGGGIFGSCGLTAEAYTITGCTFSGSIVCKDTNTYDRLFGGVGPGFSEAAAFGNITGCTFAGSIETKGGNEYVGGIYGNNGSGNVVIDGCKTTSTCLLKTTASKKSIGFIAGRPNVNGFTVKNCKIAGTYNIGEGDVTITASNIEDWMFKGSGTTVQINLEGNGFNE